MAACKPITFKGITRLRFKAIRARIHAQADWMTILGDRGTAAGFGMTATWNFDEAAQTLTIQCTKKPLIIPERLIEGKIRQLVESVKL
jgi:hypothetical protein